MDKCLVVGVIMGKNNIHLGGDFFLMFVFEAKQSLLCGSLSQLKKDLFSLPGNDVVVSKTFKPAKKEELQLNCIIEKKMLFQFIFHKKYY